MKAFNYFINLQIFTWSAQTLNKMFSDFNNINQSLHVCQKYLSFISAVSSNVSNVFIRIFQYVFSLSSYIAFNRPSSQQRYNHEKSMSFQLKSLLWEREE